MDSILVFVSDIPGQLAFWSAQYGPWIYLILFCIIFAETGLVVMPLLPGDSLLFAFGALIALDGSGLSLPLACGLLMAAAVAGDSANYWIGRKLGQRLFTKSGSRLLNPTYLERTNRFFLKHGGKTILLARFAPILRTYAPFVGGLGKMPYRRFLISSVIGTFFWVGSFISAGYFFGNLPEVKSRFHLVIIAIVILTLLPALIEFCRMRFGKNSRVFS